MAQQVVKLVMKLNPLDLTLDPVTFHMVYERATGGPSSDTELAGLATNWFNAWNGAGIVSSSPMFTLLGPTIVNGTGGGIVEAYDITDVLATGPSGPPRAVVPIAPAPSVGTNPMPEGVSMVISFRADYGFDTEFATLTRPRARDRNRLYFGPLASTVMARDTSTKRTKFQTSIIQQIVDGWDGIFGNIGDGSDNTFLQVIWSKAAGGVKPARHVWIDDRPDYQRRRTDPSGVRVTGAITGSP